MGAWILFAVVALLLVGSALMVVLSTDLVHTVLWLAVGLVTTAVVYVALSADFLAAAQVLLYTGGVVTLMLFAVMLTRRLAGAGVAVTRGHGWRRALVLSVATLGLVATAVLGSGGGRHPTAPMAADTRGLGKLFLTDLMLPFEALSLLLLGAMVGAVVLARREGGRPPIPRIPRHRTGARRVQRSGGRSPGTPAGEAP